MLSEKELRKEISNIATELGNYTTEAILEVLAQRFPQQYDEEQARQLAETIG